jgi:exoribonuclease-2
VPYTRHDLKDIARRAMINRGLLPDFSDQAIAEARALPDSVPTPEQGTRDLRRLPWISIDNDDSRDLDQLSVTERIDGGLGLLVAIADVDVAVPGGSAIDAHARANTTSVYTAAGVFPMLPLRLSTDLTSLNAREDRMAMVISMTVADDGGVTGSEVYRALVMNHAKLAYNGVAAWLDGGPPPEALAADGAIGEQVRLQDRAAQAMRARRQQRGALSLETPDAQPVFRGEVLSDLQPVRKNRATELIEDVMIAANGVVSRFLHAAGLPTLRRVLAVPKRWDRIVAIAAEAGTRLPHDPDAGALERFLNARRAADPQGFPDLSLAIVKLLGSGEYAVEPPGEDGGTPGHFGLALRAYTHATAPNRRFPDLLTQRLVKAALQRAPSPYAQDELTDLARHCTLQEDNAEKVERQVRKSAAALLMKDRIGEQFEGLVTGASPKGTWVRLFHPVVEGRVVDGFEGLDVADRTRVRLVRVDVERGFIDFARTR